MSDYGRGFHEHQPGFGREGPTGRDDRGPRLREESARAAASYGLGGLGAGDSTGGWGYGAPGGYGPGRRELGPEGGYGAGAGWSPDPGPHHGGGRQGRERHYGEGRFGEPQRDGPERHYEPKRRGLGGTQQGFRFRERLYGPY